MKSPTWKIILAVVVTAIVVGVGIYGSYFWPNFREVTSGLVKYENSEYGFSLAFPINWGKIKETITDDQIWKSIRLTANNDNERYIEIHVVLAKDKDNWIVNDFPHSLLGYNSTYRFYYVGSADNAGRLGMEDQRFFDIQKEVKEISLTFSLLPVPETASNIFTYSDDVAGISFDYQESLDTEFVRTESWPPKITVASKPFICDEANAGVGRFGKIEKRVIGDNTYCVSEGSDGAAGTTYTSYNYSFLKYSRIVIFDFTLSYPACDNFDEPMRSNCKDERASFDVDSIVEQMAKSVSVTK